MFPYSLLFYVSTIASERILWSSYPCDQLADSKRKQTPKSKSSLQDLFLSKERKRLTVGGQLAISTLKYVDHADADLGGRPTVRVDSVRVNVPISAFSSSWATSQTLCGEPWGQALRLRLLPGRHVTGVGEGPYHLIDEAEAAKRKSPRRLSKDTAVHDPENGRNWKTNIVEAGGSTLKI